MKLLRLAAWTIWFMLAWTALAHAGPVGAAIGAIATWFAKGSVLAKVISLAFGIALKVGGSLLLQATAKKQAQPGITAQVQLGGANSGSFIVGTYATAGQLEYIGTWGRSGKTPNAYVSQVISLSDVPLSAILPRIWVNGETCTIDFGNLEGTGYVVPEFTEGLGGDHFWVAIEYGTQTAANAFLMEKFGGDAERPWKADMIGRGVAYVIVTAQFNRELFTAIPQVRVETQGIKLYDPRKDSTVGGSGAQRWGQEATYEFTDNPAVIIYNILRGIYFQGEWVYGPKVPAPRLPLSNWFAAMNECDVLVAKEGGGTEKQFRCGYEIKVAEQEPIDVIQELLKACNGRMAEIGGIYKIHVGAPPLPVFFCSDEDFVVTTEQEYDPFPGLEATFNGVAATYPEPEAAWEMKDAPQRRYPEYEAQDDDRILLADVQFNAAPFALQVQRLMKALALENRRFRKNNGTLAPAAFILEPLDVISWTSARNGYVSKRFLINSMDDQANVNQAVALIEVDPSDYDWSPSDEIPWTVGPLVPRWPVPQPMTGWQVQPAIFYDATGNARRPSIEVFYDGDQEDVRAVRVLVRLAATDAIVFDGEVPFDRSLPGDPNYPTSSTILNGVFLPNTGYEVSGKYIPFSGRATEWSAWLTVVTPDVRFGPSDIYPIDIGQLGQEVKNLLDWMGGNDRTIWDEIERLNQLVSDQSGQNFLDKQELRREVVATAGNLSAKFTEQITVAVSATQAVAQRVEVLEAKFNDPATGLQATATALNAVTARVSTAEGNISANTSAITQLTSQVGAVSADALFRAESYADWAGGWASIGLRTRVSTSLSFAQAAVLLQSKSDGTARVALVAPQIVLANDVNGSIAFAPFVFQGNTAYMQNIKVQWADIVNADITWAQIQNAVVNNLQVTNAMIANLAVDTLKIAGDAIHVTNNAYDAATVTVQQTGYSDVISLSLTVPASSLNVRIIFACITSNVNLAFLVDGTEITRFNGVSGGAIIPGNISNVQLEYVWLAPTAGAHTFTIRAQSNQSGTAGVSERRLHVQAQRR
ncbi:phage tail protein [Chelativorans sp.]|uniref:phage tail protein n=1 Tax=Chelativorans sp. TaxID=2203393 RepID=UPI002811BE5C|nr:phage tail protein [Chelativorans sp.]